MAASNSLNMSTSGVQTFNATTGALDGSTTTQYLVMCGDSNNKLQPIPSIGVAGEVLTSNGAGSLPSFQAAGGGGGGITLTKFTSSGTWTKGADTKYVAVYTWNAGGGGGSGRQGASGTAGGGGGGSSGGGIFSQAPASMFGATETVTIAGTSTGGAAQASANTNGNVGSSGNITYFGNIASYPATLTNGGAGGTTATASAGGTYNYYTVYYLYGGTPMNVFTQTGSTGTNASKTNPPTPSGLSSRFLASGGGGGSGANTTTPQQAGDGISSSVSGASTIWNPGGLGGIESGTINGGVGSNLVTSGGVLKGGTGGGGGGGQSSGGSAGNGGNGGLPGGGGGGGGGSINGTNSGAGGDGGRGEVWVFEFN